MSPGSEFGAKMKAARIRLGLTQAQAAARAGMNPFMWGHYEQGRRLPNAKILITICHAINESADYLLGIKKGRV